MLAFGMGAFVMNKLTMKELTMNPGDTDRRARRLPPADHGWCGRADNKYGNLGKEGICSLLLLSTTSYFGGEADLASSFETVVLPSSII
jgi:hypothetical protein